MLRPTCRCFVSPVHLLASFQREAGWKSWIGQSKRLQTLVFIKKSLYGGRDKDCFHVVPISSKGSKILICLTFISLEIRCLVIFAQTTLQIHFCVSLCRNLHCKTSTFEHYFNCTFIAVSSSWVQVIHAKSPSIGPSGLRGPSGPHELPTKVHNAIQTIGQGTKSTFTQVGLSLKAKRHCLEDFQTPPPKKTKKQKNVCPSTPYLSIPQNLKKWTIPVMETWEPNILHQAQSHSPVHKHPQFSQTPFMGQKRFKGWVYARVLVDTIVA